jgi:hypothetical protein
MIVKLFGAGQSPLVLAAPRSGAMLPLHARRDLAKHLATLQ